jgi:hypothetical protein
MLYTPGYPAACSHLHWCSPAGWPGMTGGHKQLQGALLTCHNGLEMLGSPPCSPAALHSPGAHVPPATSHRVTNTLVSRPLTCITLPRWLPLTALNSAGCWSSSTRFVLAPYFSNITTQSLWPADTPSIRAVLQHEHKCHSIHCWINEKKCTNWLNLNLANQG